LYVLGVCDTLISFLVGVLELAEEGKSAEAFLGVLEK